MNTTQQTTVVSLKGESVIAASLTETDAALVKEYSRLTTLESELKKSKKEIRDLLVEEMGEALYGEVGGEVVVRLIPTTNRSVDYDKLFQLYPEAYRAVVSESSGHRLQIK